MDIKKNIKIAFISLSLLATACATVDNPDPLEPLNRGIYKFNDKVDTYIYKPVAKGYKFITPDPVEHSIANFYDNLTEIPTTANNLLQFKITNAGISATRFLINSTIGILGFFDPATSLGLEQKQEDFGQTLAHYGYKRSAFFVIPFLGPSTIRDAISMPVTYYMSVWPYIDPDSDRSYLLAGRFISARAEILDHEEAIEAASVDDYVAMRNAYLQNRDYMINDGEVAEELDELDY